jgi:hypothetical protein
MTERRKDILILAGLLLLLVAVFGKILFTGQIVRAPDIINEYFWTVKDIGKTPFLDLFKVDISSAGWSMYQNSGYTTEGGGSSMAFLIYHRLIYWLIPSPANVAWFMILHLFFGAIGTYLYCRVIGASRTAAFFGGLVFAVCTENASLINAGHVLKIATISYAPLAFFFLEKGLQSRRLIYFMSAAFTLAFQFFNYHWQIAFYTCLAMAVYGLIRFAGEVFEARHLSDKKPVLKLLGLNLALLAFFLTTVSISLLPLANWSKDTNRGVQSGENQGKGGLNRDEAMSWSMPPEELATFIIPGLFGFSRQEAGDPVPKNSSYYWGRMRFTQTNDYMGLLPWLLLPLPLIFRRDRYTWLAVIAIAGSLLFSMGKYSLFYNLLYDNFPGINRFRVPKMMLFITALGLSVITARGLDILIDPEVRRTRAFRNYLIGVLLAPVGLVVVWIFIKTGVNIWGDWIVDVISLPTRYEQGNYLIAQRWNTGMNETVIAAGWAAAYSVTFFALYRNRISVRLLPLLLLAMLLTDLWRVNSKFMPLAEVPVKSKGVVTPAMNFLFKDSKQYRTLPMNTDPQQYAVAEIPTVFMSTPVQQIRWQDFLDILSFNSSMPDMLNIKYLVFSSEQYQKDKSQLSPKYEKVFQSPDGAEVVVRNNAVLPKAWLVPSAFVVTDRQQQLAVLTNPGFDPRKMAFVESAPALALLPPNTTPPESFGHVVVGTYENERILLDATTTINALLTIGEKYYKGWTAHVDGKKTEIYPVNRILRGVYLTPGTHTVEFRFDPLPFKVGKYLTLTSFALFLVMLIREALLRRKQVMKQAC